MPVFDELYQRTETIVTAYRGDFDHDRGEIAKSPGVPFLHFAYAYGTYLVMLHPADSPLWPPEGQEVPYLFAHADRHRILRGAQALIRAVLCEHPTGGLWSSYDGTRLESVTVQRAQAIVDRYLSDVEKAWISA